MESEKTKEEKKFINALGKVISSHTNNKRSLERIAYEAGISKASIYDITKGISNAKIITLLRIAEALEMPLWKLIKKVEEKISI